MVGAQAPAALHLTAKLQATPGTQSKSGRVRSGCRACGQQDVPVGHCGKGVGVLHDPGQWSVGPRLLRGMVVRHHCENEKKPGHKAAHGPCRAQRGRASWGKFYGPARQHVTRHSYGHPSTSRTRQRVRKAQQLGRIDRRELRWPPWRRHQRRHRQHQRPARRVQRCCQLPEQLQGGFTGPGVLRDAHGSPARPCLHHLRWKARRSGNCVWGRYT